jgi:hypothetical protein
MKQDLSTGDRGYATPQDMQDWLYQEIRDCTKALDLRLRDATDFVAAYASGKLSAEETASRLFRYRERWGDALCGATAGDNSKDDDIISAIDEQRTDRWSDRTVKDTPLHRAR